MIRRRISKDGKTTTYSAEVFIGKRPSKTTPGKMANVSDIRTFPTKRAAELWIANHRVQRAKNGDYDASLAKTPFSTLVE